MVRRIRSSNGVLRVFESCMPSRTSVSSTPTLPPRPDSARPPHRYRAAPSRAEQLVFRSPPAGFADPTAEPVEVVCIGRGRLRRLDTFEKQAAQALTVLILADQFADILACSAVAARADLIVHERLEGLGKRYVHRAHGPKVAASTKFGKKQPFPMTHEPEGVRNRASSGDEAVSEIPCSGRPDWICSDRPGAATVAARCGLVAASFASAGQYPPPSGGTERFPRARGRAVIWSRSGRAHERKGT